MMVVPIVYMLVYESVVVCLLVVVVFCCVGGSGRRGGRVRVGGRGRCGVRVRGGVHGPGRGLGVHDHGVADLQWESVDTADKTLLGDTFPFKETEGLKV